MLSPSTQNVFVNCRKKIKTEQKSHQQVLSLHKTSREIEKGTIDLCESDTSMIV